MKSALAIQCLPLSGGDKNRTYALVDRAIAVIDASGLPYTVGPFETVVEGPLEKLFELAEKAHRAILDGGSGSGATYMKLFSAPEMDSSETKVKKFRAAGH